MTSGERLKREIEAIFSSDLFSPVTITRASSATYDPRTLKTTKTATTLQARGHVDTITTKDANGALIRTTIILTNVETMTGDVLSVAGRSYKVTSVSADQIAGLGLCWEAVVSA